MNIRIFDTLADLTLAVERTLLQRIEAGARSIGLSGGSTPQPLYERLGQNDRLREFPIIWVLVDERYVPIDDPQSNTGMIQKTLFARGVPPSHRFISFRTDLKDPVRSAEEFERDLRPVTPLDIVTLGMGEDGHTASLFPGTDGLNVEDRMATAVYVPKLSMWRVTLTKPVIRQAALRMVLVDGEKKAPILREVRAGADYPVAVVTRGVETWWFVDRPANG